MHSWQVDSELSLRRNRSALEPFRSDLLKWWATEKRCFTWRTTTDPYRILIAELLLKRTRAEQAERIYNRFIYHFPDIDSIASASYDTILTHLEGAGLYWRIQKLHAMAQTIVKEFDGSIPMTRSALESLPGIGQYVASAVLCLAYNKPEPMLDINTVRIIGRLFGLKTNDGSRRNKSFMSIMKSIAGTARPRDISLALIDLGALVCKASSALCSKCPIHEHCDKHKSLYAPGQ